MTPIFHILIPTVIGIIISLFCHEYINWNSKLLLLSFLFAIIALLFCYVKSSERRVYRKYFMVLTYIIFTLFGCIICLHSISSAKEEYGEKWKTSVYYYNPLRTTWGSNIQEHIHDYLIEKGINGQEGAIFEAMTYGYKKGLTKETKLAFSESGISHLLSLSGFHISLIYIFLHLIFQSQIREKNYHILSSLAIMVILWIYAFISSMSPSIVRAVIMCSVFIISDIRSHQAFSLNSLAIAAMISLLANPLVIMHVGFQMSYTSIIGIQLIGKRLIKSYTPFCWIDDLIFKTIIITITCTIFTIPIVAYTFGTIPLLGLFTNIIAVFIVYIIFSMIPILFITMFNSAIVELVMTLSNYLILTTKYISSLPYSHISLHFPLPLLLTSYMILGIGAIIMGGKGEKEG